MKKKLSQKKMSVRRSSIHGYGVFAEEDIKPGEIVEECYAIIDRGREEEDLIDYWFAGANDNERVFPTGFGCIYNHSDRPNATYLFHPQTRCIVFTAHRFIRKGEEILICYGEGWFSCRALQNKEYPRWQRLLRPSTSPLLRGIFVCVSTLLTIHLLKMFLV